MWLVLFISFVLMVAMVVLTINLGSLVIASFTGAPYVPSRQEAIAAMVELSRAKPGVRIAELGSGDGRVVRALADKGAEVDGYEIQPFLVWWSKWLSRTKGFSRNTHFYRKNLYNVDYGKYDAVVIYGFPNMMSRLGEKFKNEMRPGGRVVSHAFKIPGWEPVQQIENVYLYEIGSQKVKAKS